MAPRRNRNIRISTSSWLVLSVALSFLLKDGPIEAFSPSSQRIVLLKKNPGPCNPTICLKAVPDDPNKTRLSSEHQPLGRRNAMGAVSAAFLAVILSNTETASAYEKAFPVELDTSTDGASKNSRERALEAAAVPKPSPLDSSPLDLGVGAVLWGSALWFLAGSRSNPLATPLANILYDAESEEWLQDRNEGLFAKLPAPFLALLGLVFLGFGFATHVAAIYLVDGSIGISLQLAGVLMIGSGALEIGRIATGEKRETRDENDRNAMLEREFAEFAEKRLKPGGNCHRTEVVQAFRRFNAKYRQTDNPDYPLNDLEIEQLLRQWNDKNARAQRSSAGFYTGIQINTEADVFVQR